MSQNVIIEPIYDLSNINTNNHHLYAPFMVKKDLVCIDQKWWSSLHPRHKKDIISNYGTKYGWCVKDAIKQENIQNDVFWQFYNAYIDSYNISSWVSCVDGSYSITVLDQQFRTGLEQLARICSYRARKITSDDIDFIPPILKTSLTNFINRHKKHGLFMKICDTSGKNSRELTPKFSLEDVVEEIVHNKDMIKCMARYGEKTCLFLKPWTYKIQHDNEFRVIVNNRHVTGIGQQHCYKYTGITAENMERFSASILDFYDGIKDNIPFNSCVLDVWIDKDDVTHLIEINPGEMWASSGSCLFNWVTDYNKLHQNTTTYARYIPPDHGIYK